MSVMRFEPFGDPFRALDRLSSQLVSGRRTPMGMPMDVWQADDGYHVDFDLPGVDPDSIDISCERNMLTIRADRRAEYQEGHNVLLAERPQGGFTRQLQISDALDAGKVAATYDNGVLKVTIPMAEAAQPRRIQVQRGENQQSLPVSGREAAGEGEKSGEDGEKQDS